ncbi:hypothetical protein BZA05DRAFT_80380 [Tricharina praecox]|uniref:uncharacterized protein n=1 Tax=Tricharina praecox TaxID=43433 RepID=UPI0022202468|nr:uncharacterized protein BZA05DRAFT_80380 [Tricharina praecox]KAI5849002.1 hypothetical protein BZA05DRAFT_80380 [Tricharina praecox]
MVSHTHGTPIYRRRRTSKCGGLPEARENRYDIEGRLAPPGFLLSEQLKDAPEGLGPLPKELRDSYRDYGAVFNWLRKRKVKKIIKLTVEDKERLPHSDRTIEEALKDIEVEILDWQQEDLCSDKIALAAKNVVEISLYTSGKRAILQNWCGKNGLEQLKQLKKVTIKIDPNKALLHFSATPLYLSGHATIFG